MNKKKVRSTNYWVLHVALGVLALVAVTSLVIKQYSGSQVVKPNPENVVQRTSVPPDGWQEVSNEYYTLYIPADWKSSMYSNEQSVSLCPINDCQDAKIWVEVQRGIVVDAAVDNLVGNKMFRNTPREIRPIQVNNHQGKLIHFEMNDPSRSYPVYAYVQMGDDVLAFGYYEEDQLSQEIVATLSIK